MTPPCEVCGAPDADCVIDMVEGEPAQDAEGRLWRTWQPDGAHWYCERHMREPVEKARTPEARVETE